MKIEHLDGIYVIHYAPLTERKAYLERRFKELGISEYARWKISPADEKLTKKDLSLYDADPNSLEERKRVLKCEIPKVIRKDIVVILQHIKLLREISKKKKGIFMVFEDDALLDEKFVRRLKETIKKLKEIEWDICYTDRASLFIEPRVKRDSIEEITLYKPPENRANTTGSYLIKPETARKILRLMKKFAVSADLEMSYLQKKYNLKVYWTVPFLTRQGSIENIYKSDFRKESITGILISLIRKTEKISPEAAKILSFVFDKSRKAMYKSKFLRDVKDKIKNLI